MRLRLTTVLAVALIALGAWVMVSGLPATVAVPPSPTATRFATPPASALATAPPSATIAPPRAIPDGYRIQIPRLRIDLPIKEGDNARDIDDQKTPEGAAFHLERSAIPGEGSNTYLYAHARTGMFLALWQAKEGDEVVVVTPDGKTLHYVVREVHPRVPPNDTKWVLPSATERLTLQTSTGPNPADPRFVVVALPKV